MSNGILSIRNAMLLEILTFRVEGSKYMYIVKVQ